MLIRAMRIVLLGLSASFFLVAVLFGLEDDEVNRSLENSREIQAAFDRAHAQIQSWRAERGRMPTTIEFDDWAASQPVRGYGPIRVRLLGFIPDDVKEEFGSPPADGYLLSFRRSDWDEYSPSWGWRSSVVLEKSRYFIFGSAVRDSAVMGSAGIILLACSLLLRTRTA